MAKLIDVTGLTLQQIAMIEEIVNALRIASRIEENKEEEKEDRSTDEKLQELHDEFSWLIADLGVKEPITRSKIYDIE